MISGSSVDTTEQLQQKEQCMDKAQTPSMFTAIAERYDLLNHVLSMNIDRRWRGQLVRAAGAGKGARVLDAATGTADVAIEFARHTRADSIVGVDRSSGMLEVGERKLERLGLGGRVELMECDVLELPFPDGSFDAVTIAFGLRNLPDYARGIDEMTRVLKPGGKLLVLEFFPPRRGLFLKAYRLYLGKVLPVAGGLISGSRDAYRYLASSIESFLSREEMEQHMRASGLTDVHPQRLTGGIAFIYSGQKS